MNFKKIYLKPGKDYPIRKKHHWIFSGAIEKGDKFEDGDIAEVYSAEGELLGHAYLNNTTTIAGRMLNFSKEDPIKSLRQNIARAFGLRSELFYGKDTNCYRVINGEGDYIPGLIVDRYNTVLVIQISTVGMNSLKDKVIEFIREVVCDFDIDCIYEKSTMSARKKDGLESFEGVLFGKLPEYVEVLENGVKFSIDIKSSQKTGLFLDQREMRSLIGGISNGKRVLNCFSYTGGFSLYAKKAGAISTTSIDIDPRAIEQAKINFEVNNFDTADDKFISGDVFDFLKSDSLDYDVIILDPPAFAKKKEDIQAAQRGYGEINRVTMSKMPQSSYLLTCSCSYHVSQELFEEIVKKSAQDSKRNVRIIGRHTLAMDHPINIFHSEIDYLKGLLLYIE